VSKKVEVKLRILAETEFICWYKPWAGGFIASLENATAASDAKALFSKAPFEKTFGGNLCP
jgi:hypothetical protein